MLRLRLVLSSAASANSRAASSKARLKDYVFPEIKAEDVVQNVISGWGPGGQKVNTSQNAVQLKHTPTGVSVKVHESRLLPKNIEIAHERLKLAVDRHLNGEQCYEEQLRRLQRAKEEKASAARQRRREMKMEMKIEGERKDE